MRLQSQLSQLQSVTNERDMLKQKVDKLESIRTQLAAEAQKASTMKDDSLAHITTLQDDLQKSRTVAAKEKAELQTQHQGEVEGLRKSLAEVEDLRGCVVRLEEQNQQLSSQVDESSKLEEQVKSLGTQLEAEQTSKKVRPQRWKRVQDFV